MRSNWSRVAVLAVAGCMSVVACGDDDDSTSNTGGTSGSKNDAGEGGSSTAGKSGGTGGKTGGTGGTGTAGKMNTAGAGEGGAPLVGGGTGPDGGVGGAAGGVGGADLGGAGGDAPTPQPYCAPGSDFGSGGEGGGFGASCDVQKNYGDICTPFEGVLRGQGDPNILDWYGEIDSGGNIDELRMQLYPNTGPFGDTLTTGTFQITGDDLNYGTCGLCVLLFENSVGQSARGTYFATGGTVKITQVEPRLIATITNLTLEHVTIDDVSYESTPVGDSCTTKFTKVEIDAPVPAK